MNRLANLSPFCCWYGYSISHTAEALSFRFPSIAALPYVKAMRRMIPPSFSDAITWIIKFSCKKTDI